MWRAVESYEASTYSFDFAVEYCGVRTLLPTLTTVPPQGLYSKLKASSCALVHDYRRLGKLWPLSQLPIWLNLGSLG